MAPTNLSARVERLEKASARARFLPRVHVKILGDTDKPLLGYRIGIGKGASDLWRERSETDAELLRRARTALDDKPEEGSIVRVFEELREP